MTTNTREAFEAWAKKEGHLVGGWQSSMTRHIKSNGEYASAKLESMWVGYQAALSTAATQQEEMLTVLGARDWAEALDLAGRFRVKAQTIEQQGEAVAELRRLGPDPHATTCRAIAGGYALPPGTYKLYTHPIPSEQDKRDALPEKPSPAIMAALRAGSFKDYPSDELCRVRWAAIRTAITVEKGPA